jgi:hypothetical protein
LPQLPVSSLRFRKQSKTSLFYCFIFTKGGSTFHSGKKPEYSLLISNYQRFPVIARGARFPAEISGFRSPTECDHTGNFLRTTDEVASGFAKRENARVEQREAFQPAFKPLQHQHPHI